MKRVSAIASLTVLAAIALLTSCNTTQNAGSTTAPAASTKTEVAPLQLIQKIPTPGITGRIDHFTAFPKRRLLIFAALGNNSVEVVNSFQAKVIQHQGIERTAGRTLYPGIQQAFRGQRWQRCCERL